MTGGFVAGGREVYAGLGVCPWPRPFSRPARRQTRAVVLHWTGAENPPRTVYRTLRRRGLSVHFVIDPAGVVWQLADADARCSHAGSANAYSVGIEIVSRGSNLRAPARGHARPLRLHEVQGRPLRYYAFLPAQTQAAIALTRALCEHYALPFVVPRSQRGLIASEALSAAELAQYRGVLGHLHIKRAKLDPGLELLYDVDRAGLPVS